MAAMAAPPAPAPRSPCGWGRGPPLAGGDPMELYLMRHGEAMAAEQDPHRPLTEAGRAAAERVAARTAAVGARLDRIYHSDAPRASQTAAILAERLGATDRM